MLAADTTGGLELEGAEITGGLSSGFVSKGLLSIVPVRTGADCVSGAEGAATTGGDGRTGAG
jgi:hypothetical protein